MRHWVKPNEPLCFFLLTFAVSWAIWIPSMLEMSRPAHAHLLCPGRLGALAALYGPTFSALVITALADGWAGLRELLGRLARWRVPARWYLVVIVGAPLLRALALWVDALVRGIAPEVTGADWWFMLALLPATLVAGPAAEELGWRGFALPRLQARWNALVSSVVLGVVWTAWHLPPFIWHVEGYSPTQPFAWFLLWVVSFSILFTWVFNHTRGSVWMAILLHMAVNHTSRFASELVSTAHQATLTVTLVTATAAAVVVLFFGAEHLNRRGKRFTLP